MPVVTIARQLGSGGEEVAALVGRQLGWRVLDGDLLVAASARSGIPVGYLAGMDERGRSMWGRPVDLVRLVPLPPINPELPDVLGDRYPPTGPIIARGEGLMSPAYWASEAYATLMARTIQAEAANGDVVVVGRAGNEALAGRAGVLHVLVVAADQTRVERIMAAQGLGVFDALDRRRWSDRQRAAYVRQFFNAHWLDPLRYDLVVDTDRLTFERAAEVVATAARRLPAADGTAGEMAAAAAHG